MNVWIPLFRNNYLFSWDRRYCGAIMKRKRPHPGENWLRGSDCHDGKAWQVFRVLKDVICCELQVGRWRRKRSADVTGSLE